MDAKRRRLRRRQLDEQFGALRRLELPSAPQAGWIEAIREAVGMNLGALGRRLGVSRQTAHELTRAEQDGSITVKRLRAAADALGCDLLVLVVPRAPLEDMVRERAMNVARDQVLRTNHSMALEEQSVPDKRLRQMISDVADELVERGDHGLWD